MNRIQASWRVFTGRPVASVLTIALLLAGGLTRPVLAAGVQWQDLTIQQAIEEARAKDTMVMVDVWDSHCGSCSQLDADVWETPDGVKVAEGLIPIKIQSTVDVGHDFMKLYPVTGLPAIIFIKPDGTELDRVEGYFGNRNVFLDAARPLRDGLDPLPFMETKLKASPDSLPLLLGVMEKYLFRKRETEAAAVYQKIQKLDPRNAQRTAERSMQMMARFEENWKADYMKANEYYRQMVERFPDSPSAGGNADAAFKSLYRIGRGGEWKDWICPVLDKYPNYGSLQRSVASTALVWGQRGDCFAQAARRAAKLYVPKAAYYDSIAVVLGGGAGGPGK
jgi:hypothetical protein